MVFGFLARALLVLFAYLDCLPDFDLCLPLHSVSLVFFVLNKYHYTAPALHQSLHLGPTLLSVLAQEHNTNSFMSIVDI